MTSNCTLISIYRHNSSAHIVNSATVAVATRMATSISAFSAQTLSKYAQISIEKKGPQLSPRPPSIPFSKLNGPSIFHWKLISGRGKRCGWMIRASQSSSTPTNSGTMSADLSQDLDRSLSVVEVFDLSGNMVRLTDLWKERKAVVGFARHFGCVLCRKRADILASQKECMDGAGVALVLIGPGSIEQAKAFAEQTKFPGEVYADPNHSAFDAFKFVSGVSTTFTPSAGMKIIESYIQGYRQDWGLSFQKDTMSSGGWQQGGILVAGPGENNIVYLHKDKEAGDDPDIQDILKACCT